MFFDLVLPDLDGVVLAAPDLGVIGATGVTVGAGAGTMAGGAIAGGVGGVPSAVGAGVGALVVTGGSSGFLNGSSQVCST